MRHAQQTVSRQLPKYLITNLVSLGHMTTIHAYTGDQNLLDTIHKDPRRAQGLPYQ